MPNGTNYPASRSVQSVGSSYLASDPLNLFTRPERPDIFDRISQPPPQVKNDPLGLFNVEKARAAGYSPERIKAFQAGEIPALSGDPRDFVGAPSEDIFDHLQSSGLENQSISKKQELVGFEGRKILHQQQTTIKEPNTKKYGWEDWVNAYIGAYSGTVPFEEYQAIDKQVAEPVFEKASKIASFAALAIYGVEGITSIPELWRMAKGALSKSLTPQQQFETAKYLKDMGFKEESKTIADLARKFPQIKEQLLAEQMPSLVATVKPQLALPSPTQGDILDRLVTSGYTQAGKILKAGIPTIPSEAGKLSLEPLATGVSVVRNLTNNLDKIFTRFVGLDKPTQQMFINHTEGNIELMEQAAQTSVEITKSFSDAELNQMVQHFQEPLRVSMPVAKGITQLRNKLVELEKWSLKEVNRPFVTSKRKMNLLEKAIDADKPIPKNIELKVPKWPDNVIKDLSLKREELRSKLSSISEVDKLVAAQSNIDNISNRIGKLLNIRHLHQVTKPKKGLVKVVGQHKVKTISSRPSKFLGRTFATREEAKAAGHEVGSLPAMIADMIYETTRVQAMDKFIKNINRNPDFSLAKELAPNDWVSIDKRRFPAGQNRKFHPAIADALVEITYTSNASELTRAYDKLNWVGKFVGFYQPMFMVRNNTSQGIRVSGFTYLVDIPKAIQHWSRKDELYMKLRRNGVFNRANNYGQATGDIADKLLAEIRRADLPTEYKEIAKKVLNPVQLWKWLNEFTWQADQVQRIATYQRLSRYKRIHRYYSDFEIMELTNDGHANYDKIPKRTRKVLNRAIFTPAYKISIARITGRIHKEPKALWPMLLRHYAMKIMFSKYLPMAVAGYYAYKKSDKRARVEGYRLIISEPGAKKETVYSFTDPLLEATKIENRPYFRTLEYNLASLPTTFVNTIRGSLFESKNPDWVEKTNSFFKVGAPVLKELVDWRKEDKEGWQKFVQTMGFVFIYERNRKPELRKTAFESAAKAMDLWVDRKVFLAIKDPKTFFREVKKHAKDKDIREYMEKAWGTRKFNVLSYEARREVLDYFSLSPEQYNQKYVRPQNAIQNN